MRFCIVTITARLVVLVSPIVAILAWHYGFSALIFIPACFLSIGGAWAIFEKFLRCYQKRRRDLIIWVLLSIGLLFGAFMETHFKKIHDSKERWAFVITLFFFSAICLNHAVSEWRKRKSEEEGWQKMVKSENFWLVLRDPEWARPEFIEWLEETNPKALLQLKKQVEFPLPEHNTN